MVKFNFFLSLWDASENFMKVLKRPLPNTYWEPNETSKTELFAMTVRVYFRNLLRAVPAPIALSDYVVAFSHSKKFTKICPFLLIPHACPTVLKYVLTIGFLYVFNSFMTEVFIYGNQSIDLQSKSMEWFWFDRDLRHESVKGIPKSCKYYQTWLRETGNKWFKCCLSDAEFLFVQNN